MLEIPLPFRNSSASAAQVPLLHLLICRRSLPLAPTNTLLGLAAAGGYPGQSNETITITGTNFLDPTGKGALPVFTFGNGITVTPVGTVQITSGSTAQSMQVSITIDPNTPIGTSYVSVTTGSPTTFEGGSYTQQTSANAFIIAAYSPTITSVGPANTLLGLPSAGGYPGQTERLTITGTNFLDPTGKGALPVFTFGNGITVTPVGNVQVTSGSTAQSMQVSITIDPNTPIGTSYVSVTTGSPTTFKGGSYTQQTSADAFVIAAYSPTITSVGPANTLLGLSSAGGYPGQSDEIITITGNNLVDPTGKGALPVFTFGNGITVTPISVSGTLGVPGQIATVSLVIDPTTPAGTVYPSVTTGSPTTFKGATTSQQTPSNAFIVRDYLPTILSIGPANSALGLAGAGGYPGETETLTITGTNFLDPTQNGAPPVFNFGTGITVTPIGPVQTTAGSTTQSISVNIVISSNQGLGTLYPTVTTGSSTTFLGGTYNVQSPQTAFLVVAPPACATNVSNQIVVTRGAYHFNPIQPNQQEYSQTVTLNNTGTTTITGPIYFEVSGLGSSVTLLNPSGATTCALPIGTSYVTDSIVSLAPGTTTQVLLKFRNTNPSQTITYTSRVLAGSGTP